MEIFRLVIGGVLISVIIIRLFAKWVKRRNAKKELQRSAEDKLREEALDRVLVEGRKQKRGKQSANVPFEVTYDHDQRKKSGHLETRSGTEVMIQLTERCELSTRKYMFHIVDHITIGSQMGENDIVVAAPRIAARQCELFRIGQELFAKNIGGKGTVILNRGKNGFAVGSEAVLLKNHDELQIGEYFYEVTIL